MSLRRWFKEKWIDVKTGKECGRGSASKSKRAYPACRPSRRVSSKTPKTASEMSSSEKAKFKRVKKSSKKISYQHRRKKMRKEHKSPSGGLTAAGRRYFKRKEGANLKAPVTGKVKRGSKAAARRRSFCARMSGVKGPMKDSKGRPTRKALALRKWKC